MTHEEISDTLDRMMAEDKSLKAALEKVCMALEAFSADDDTDEYTDSLIGGIAQVATRCAKSYLQHDKRLWKRDIGREGER